MLIPVRKLFCTGVYDLFVYVEKSYLFAPFLYYVRAYSCVCVCVCVSCPEIALQNLVYINTKKVK